MDEGMKWTLGDKWETATYGSCDLKYIWTNIRKVHGSIHAVNYKIIHSFFLIEHWKASSSLKKKRGWLKFTKHFKAIFEEIIIVFKNKLFPLFSFRN